MEDDAKGEYIRGGEIEGVSSHDFGGRVAQLGGQMAAGEGTGERLGPVEVGEHHVTAAGREGGASQVDVQGVQVAVHQSLGEDVLQGQSDSLEYLETGLERQGGVGDVLFQRLTAAQVEHQLPPLATVVHFHQLDHVLVLLDLPQNAHFAGQALLLLPLGLDTLVLQAHFVLHEVHLLVETLLHLADELVMLLYVLEHHSFPQVLFQHRVFLPEVFALRKLGHFVSPVEDESGGVELSGLFPEFELDGEGGVEVETALGGHFGAVVIEYFVVE